MFGFISNIKKCIGGKIKSRGGGANSELKFFKVRLRTKGFFNGYVNEIGAVVTIKAYDKGDINKDAFEFIEDLGSVREYLAKEAARIELAKKERHRQDMENKKRFLKDKSGK
jgi:hypothetical protein